MIWNVEILNDIHGSILFSHYYYNKNNFLEIDEIYIVEPNGNLQRVIGYCHCLKKCIKRAKYIAGNIFKKGKIIKHKGKVGKFVSIMSLQKGKFLSFDVLN